jgi:hypothetical protein
MISGKLIAMSEMSDRLMKARIHAGYRSVQDAADAMEALGVKYPTYAGHENGASGFRAPTAEIYAKKFKVNFEWLMRGKGPMLPDEERTVPIVGYAGAGPDGSVLFAEGDGNYGEATAPIDASETTEALEVRGDSMHGLANDGWLIFYDDKIDPSAEHMGEPCVCWLASGRVLIKEPQWGTAPGLFHLTSLNARTMPDVPVHAMALVTDIKTRAAAKKYIKRHPNMPIDDLVVEK